MGDASLGRLVTCIGGEPEIFPVNFVVQDRTVLFRTGEGTKLFVAVTTARWLSRPTTTTSPKVNWSVIVKGHAQVLNTDDEIRKADRAELFPWTATQKDHYIRVIPSESPAATSIWPGARQLLAVCVTARRRNCCTRAGGRLGGAKVQLSGFFGEYTTGISWPTIGHWSTLTAIR